MPETPSQLRQIWREHAPLLVVVFIYVVLGVGVQAALGEADLLALVGGHGGISTVAALFLVFFFSGHALMSLPRVPEGTPALGWIWRQWRTHYFTARRAGGFLVVHLAIPMFSSVFGGLKILFPTINPFSWDEPFHRADLLVHLGYEPWRLLQAVFGHPWITVGINAAYNAWFLLMLGIIVWQAGSARRDTRFQFFMTFLVMWVLMGTLLAMAASSAGPCYYGYVVPGVDPYAEQMAYLHRVHESGWLWAVDVQQTLWDVYTSGEVKTVSGISAMPSMHVSVATLFALVGFAHRRWLGWLLTAFAVIIQIGSVHLAWHYAVDGYVGCVLTIVIWKGVGVAMRRFGWTPPPLAEPEAR